MFRPIPAIIRFSSERVLVFIRFMQLCNDGEISSPVVLIITTINLYATGFKWLQSTFAYDIIFARHLNISTWFTKNFIIPGTKKDLIMD